MGAHALHVNMTRGAITPKMRARVDTDLYESALKTASGVYVSRYGGVFRTPGTYWLGSLKDSATGTYMIPFVFNETQVYVIELCDQYIRFWTRDGQVQSGGAPYQVATPYVAADLHKVQHWQSGDEVYLACEGYPPKVLTRSAETSWALADYEAKDGPYMDVNTTGTTLTPANYGCLTPVMTSNTAPSGTVSSSPSSTTAWNVFDKSETTDLVLSGTTGYVQYRLASSAQKIVDGYYIKSTQSVNEELTPSSWKVYGSNDGSTWVLLDSRTGETGWLQAETRFYSFTNETAYEYYRFQWFATESDFAQTRINEIGFHVAAEDQTAFNLTASDTAGINNDTGFQSDDVGRLIRIFGDDGHWRWMQIESVTSTTVVTVVVHDQAFSSLAGAINWRLGAWSEQTGWPAAVNEFEGRLGWARTTENPFTVWLTRSADLDNFGVSDPVVDDDAITIKPGGGGVTLDPINWFLGSSNLIIGTRGALRAYGPRDSGKAFAPGNVRRLTETAESTHPTVRAQQIAMFILFLDQYGKRVYEAAYSAEADGYVAQEASVLSEHLVRNRVTRWAFQSSPNRILWCVTASGGLLSITYDRDQKVFGITERPVDGTVTDVCALPGDENDDLFITVQRTVDGSTVGYMERLAEYYEDGDHDYPVFFDSAAVETGTDLTSISGADHLEGKTVGVWVDGEDVGDAVITAGAFTLPDSAVGDTVVYGLRNRWDVVLLKAARWGAQDGRGLGYPVKVANGTLHLYESAGIQVGVEGALDDWLPDDPNGDASTLLTGDYDLGTVDERWQNGGQLALGGDRAYPVNILGVTVELEGSL